MCDGVSHCQDRSDELGCSKMMEGCDHQCDEKSRCIPENFLCDGESDCQDGSDETNCGMLSLNQETKGLVVYDRELTLILACILHSFECSKQNLNNT